MSSNVRNITAPLGMAGAPVDAQQAEEMRAKLEEAIAEIRQARDLDQYMDMNDRAQLEIMEAKLQSTLTLINHFLTTGEWGVPGLGGPNGQGGYNAAVDLIRDLNPGWNGDVNVTTQVPVGYDLSALQDSLPPGAELGGFLYIQERPGQDTNIIFQASQNTLKIEGFSHGNDIVYVETYLDEAGNEQTRYWVGRDHGIRVDVNILIDAHNLQAGRLEGIPDVTDTSPGLIADFHRVLRISDGSHNIQAGAVGGIAFVGSDLNDTFSGTQGDDYIRGLKGSDTLMGEGGVDIIYGDDGDWVNARTNEVYDPAAIREQLGLRTDLPDGDDTIDGGAGWDQMDGGGGFNYGVATDSVTGPNPEGKTNIHENLPRSSSRPANSSWFVAGESEGWDNIRVENDYTVSISQTDETLTDNSELVLQMPAGYDYAYAEPDPASQGIKITFVKHVENGAPQTFVVIVRGALRERNGNLYSPFTLKIKGNGGANIIDFHTIDFGNNNFVVESVGGDDMVINPNNDLNKQGLSLYDLIGPDNRIPGSEIQTSGLVDEVVPRQGDDLEGEERQPGVFARREGNEIWIETTNDGSEGPTNVSIDPTGYDRGYVLEDPRESGDLLVVLVKESVTGGAPSVLVLRIKDYENFAGEGAEPGNYSSWLSVGPSAESGGAGEGEDGRPDQPDGGFSLIPLIAAQRGDGFEAGNIIDAGLGDDFVFEWAGDTVSGAESGVTAYFSEVAEINSNPDTPTPTVDTDSDGTLDVDDDDGGDDPPEA